MTLRVIRKRLYENEGAPGSTRVNSETGEVETTPDGGETWTPNPGADPRINPAYTLPPNTLPDARCAAAAGMVENVRRTLNTAGAGTTVAGIATAMIGLLLIPGVGWMFYAFLLFAGAFVAAGSIATVAAFTEDVYDWLLCTFYDQLDSDGRITEAGLEAVIDAAVAEQPNALVNGYLRLLVNLHHLVGFNNAGVTYADPSADCTCVPQWCYGQHVGADGLGEWALAWGTVTGEGVEGAAYGDFYRAAVTWTATEALNRVGVYWAEGCPGAANIYVVDDTTSTVIFTVNIPANPDGIAYNAVDIPAGHSLRWELQCAGGAFILVAPLVGGEGENPFGVENCP